MSILDFSNLVNSRPRISWPGTISTNHLYRFYNLGESIYHSQHKILRKTPKGMWLENSGFKDKFVNTSWKKQFAYSTPELALKAFIYRKIKQIEILEKQLEIARAVLTRAESNTNL